MRNEEKTCNYLLQKIVWRGLSEKQSYVIFQFNSFLANVPILYPLKTAENL